MSKFNNASECVRCFYNSYLGERDYRNLTKFLSEKSSFFGTKLLEVVSGHEELGQLENLSTGAMQEEFAVNELWLTETELSPEIFLVNGEIEITNTLKTSKGVAGRNRVRLTAVCKKHPEDVKITHFHLSVPEQGVANELLQPLAELLKKNRQLEDILLMQTKALEEQAQLDVMTNILNRKAIVESLKKMIAGNSTKYQELSVLILDIDDFKLINDLQGQVTGDAIILGVVAFVQDNIRPSDVLGRYGDDEFMLLLPNADHNQAAIVVERLKRVALNRNLKDYDGVVSLSIGCAQYVAGKDPDSLIKEAEAKLEKDKMNKIYS